MQAAVTASAKDEAIRKGYFLVLAEKKRNLVESLPNANLVSNRGEGNCLCYVAQQLMRKVGWRRVPSIPTIRNQIGDDKISSLNLD